MTLPHSTRTPHCAPHTVVDGGAGYQLPVFPFIVPPELATGTANQATVRRYPVVIVGGGLVGLTLACDLAVRGIRSVVLDEDDTVGVRGASSRGMCYAQKSLEVFDRLGLYERLLGKGVTWSVGRTLAQADEIYRFDAKPASVSSQTPFLNLQQFYLEWFLVDRIDELGLTDLRWKHTVIGTAQHGDYVAVEIDTPAGAYRLEADWLIDASGANSPVRDHLGVPVSPDRSTDRWCICDVRFTKPLPAERWTWVAAPFNEGRAVWQHPMADHVWRLDYQMAPDCDPGHVSDPDVARERVRAHLGDDVDFELVWVGPWHYRTQVLDRFRVDRVLFAGDAAHVMSPFGARGGNSGIQDADNLGWKLAMVLRGLAPDTLLDTYSEERRAAAVENVTVTRRTARFLAPQSEAERTLRDAVIALAKHYAFARALVNTGRLSVPNHYGSVVPLPNVPLRTPQGDTTLATWSLAQGTRLIALVFPQIGERAADCTLRAAEDETLHVAVCAPDGDITDAAALARHTAARPGTVLLLRPDLYLAGRIDASDADVATPAATPAALRARVAAALMRTSSHAASHSQEIHA